MGDSEGQILVRSSEDHILLAALDLLLLFMILLFIAFIAIRYDAEKGIGDKKYVILHDLQDTIEHNLGDEQHYLTFQPLVLDQTSLLLFRYERGRIELLGTFDTVTGLLESGKLDETLPCIIYEKEFSPSFPEIIRAFALRKIPMGLGQIAK